MTFAADSLRIYDERDDPVEVKHLELVGTIPGVRPVAVAARCGPGTARIRANATGTALAWRAPGSDAWGQWVPTPADGDYLLSDGEDRDAWLRVHVHKSYLPAAPAENLVHLADVFSNPIAADDLTAAEAAAGNSLVYEVVLANDSTVVLSGLVAWLDGSTENLEISADGSSWSSPVTEAAGLALGDLPAGQAVTLYLRRTIAASADSDAGVLNHLHFAFNGL